MKSLSDANGPTESAQDTAYRWLKGRIATLPRHYGTFLTEADVSKAAFISRTPVREALLRLKAEGLLQIVPKKGAYIPPITDAEVNSVMEARGLVEDWCVRRTALLATSVSVMLDAFIQDQQKSQGDPIAFIEYDREFHRAIVRAAGNPVFMDLYESLRDRQLRMGLNAIASSEKRTRTVLEEHHEIADGVRSGDANRAAAAMATHLSGTLAALHLPIVASGTFQHQISFLEDTGQ